MDKLQMDPPLGGGTPPQVIVKAQRVARPLGKAQSVGIVPERQPDAGPDRGVGLH
jgi:hypothetical protein